MRVGQTRSVTVIIAQRTQPPQLRRGINDVAVNKSSFVIRSRQRPLSYSSVHSLQQKRVYVTSRQKGHTRHHRFALV